MKRKLEESLNLSYPEFNAGWKYWYVFVLGCSGNQSFWYTELDSSYFCNCNCNFNQTFI